MRNLLIATLIPSMLLEANPLAGKYKNVAETSLNYIVSEQYTWTAPADIEFATGSNGSEIKSGTIEVTENIIPDHTKLNISVKSDQTFELSDVTNVENKRNYTIKEGTTVLRAGSSVLTLDSGVSTGSADLDFQMVAVDTEVAGTYKGTVTFVADIQAADVIVDGSGDALSVY